MIALEAQVAKDGCSRLEGPAGDVECLVKVVGGGCGGEIRPEQFHHLLAVKAVAPREGEQLDEARGLAQPPIVFPYDPRPRRDLEATEQRHAQGFPARRMVRFWATLSQGRSRRTLHRRDPFPRVRMIEDRAVYVRKVPGTTEETGAAGVLEYQQGEEGQVEKSG